MLLSLPSSSSLCLLFPFTPSRLHGWCLPTCLPSSPDPGLLLDSVNFSRRITALSIQQTSPEHLVFAKHCRRCPESTWMSPSFLPELSHLPLGWDTHTPSFTLPRSSRGPALLLDVLENLLAGPLLRLASLLRLPQIPGILPPKSGSEHVLHAHSLFLQT